MGSRREREREGEREKRINTGLRGDPLRTRGLPIHGPVTAGRGRTVPPGSTPAPGWARARGEACRMQAVGGGWAMCVRAGGGGRSADIGNLERARAKTGVPCAG